MTTYNTGFAVAEIYIQILKHGKKATVIAVRRGEHVIGIPNEGTKAHWAPTNRIYYLRPRGDKDEPYLYA